MQYQNENYGDTRIFRHGVHDYFCIHTHLHEYSEIYLMTRGASNVTIAGKPYIIRENQAVFILPNQPHSYNLDCSFTCDYTNFECHCINISNDLIPLFFDEIGNNVFESPVIDFSDNIDVFNQILNCTAENLIMATACLYSLCNEFLKKSPLITARAIDDDSLFQKVFSYLHEHYKEDITLKGLAAKFGYNEKYLSSSLHAVTGTNFRTLLAQYRVSEAKKLLFNKKFQSVSSIAHHCGFDSINSFNRIFKLMVGKTPTEYRKKR